MSTEFSKTFIDLTYNDFVAHPIWGYIEYDEDEVMPVDYPGHLIPAPGGDNISVACEFQLNDGTVFPGVIAVNVRSRTLFALKFFQTDKKLSSVIVDPRIAIQVLERTSAILGKPQNQIFPVKYSTPYYFEDGGQLAGEYRPE